MVVHEAAGGDDRGRTAAGEGQRHARGARDVRPADGEHAEGARARPVDRDRAAPPVRRPGREAGDAQRRLGRARDVPCRQAASRRRHRERLHQAHPRRDAEALSRYADRDVALVHRHRGAELVSRLRRLRHGAALLAEPSDAEGHPAAHPQYVRRTRPAHVADRGVRRTHHQQRAGGGQGRAEVAARARRPGDPRRRQADDPTVAEGAVGVHGIEPQRSARALATTDGQHRCGRGDEGQRPTGALRAVDQEPPVPRRDSARGPPQHPHLAPDAPGDGGRRERVGDDHVGVPVAVEVGGQDGRAEAGLGLLALQVAGHDLLRRQRAAAVHDRDVAELGVVVGVLGMGHAAPAVDDVGEAVAVDVGDPRGGRGRRSRRRGPGRPCRRGTAGVAAAAGPTGPGRVIAAPTSRTAAGRSVLHMKASGDHGHPRCASSSAGAPTPAGGYAALPARGRVWPRFVNVFTSERATRPHPEDPPDP